VPKVKTLYICTSCGSTSPRWIGKCPDCGAWDSLEEHKIDPSASSDPHAQDASWTLDAEDATQAEKAIPISQIDEREQGRPRLGSGLGEFDRVLGGGVVPGSALLIGGEPGIGKSTLLLQTAAGFAASGAPTLYVSSEESAKQIKLRATRLGVGARDGLHVLADTNLARITEQCRKLRPEAIIVDSIQMLYRGDLDAPPGSITQLRRCAAELITLAKRTGAAVILVGHVTKEGALAGPRLLEHLVDAVVSFEGDRSSARRIIRASKNRFGTTLEIGILEMTGVGLRVPSDGAIFAPDPASPPRPGSVPCPAVHGTRCLMVEVQALTATGFLGAAKRKASGLDSNRLAMLIAVLEQHAELRLADRDIFAQAVGGVRVVEPACDLALLLAIAGAQHRRSLGPACCAFGEVGLGGELRPVPACEQRLREAARLGYTVALLPVGSEPAEPVAGIELVGVRSVNGAIEHLG